MTISKWQEDALRTMSLGFRKYDVGEFHNEAVTDTDILISLGELREDYHELPKLNFSFATLTAPLNMYSVFPETTWPRVKFRAVSSESSHFHFQIMIFIRHAKTGKILASRVAHERVISESPMTTGHYVNGWTKLLTYANTEFIEEATDKQPFFSLEQTQKNIVVEALRLGVPGGQHASFEGCCKRYGPTFVRCHPHQMHRAIALPWVIEVDDRFDFEKFKQGIQPMEHTVPPLRDADFVDPEELYASYRADYDQDEKQRMESVADLVAASLYAITRTAPIPFS